MDLIVTKRIVRKWSRELKKPYHLILEMNQLLQTIPFCYSYGKITTIEREKTAA